jgi:hypothetical protein
LTRWIHVTGIIRAAGKNAQLNIKVEGGSGGPASPSCSVMYYANSYSAPAEGPATCPDGTPQRGRGKPNATCSRGISCCSGQCVGGYCR